MICFIMLSSSLAIVNVKPASSVTSPVVVVLPPLSVTTLVVGLKLKKSPALAKLSASCKAAAKRKFKVYPSAYANMWAAKTQRQGKC